MPHVAIAGAGLAGRLAGWRLARAGWRVSLFDRSLRTDRCAAAHVAAAMLAPLAERPGATEAVFTLGLRAMALWPRWLDELRADTGRTVYHRRDGTLVVAHPVDRGTLAHFARGVLSKVPAVHHDAVRRLDGRQVGELEPALAGRFAEGLLLAGEGQMANDELLAALEVALDQAGAAWHEGEDVVALDARGVETASGRCEADHVIDTRGTGARGAWPGLHGVRGEVLSVWCPAVTLTRPVRLMHPRYQLYIAPRPDHRYVVGATELDSEDAGPVTVRSVLELASALYSLHPGFGEARVERMSAGLRPALPDHEPALRCEGGVWAVNGLYRHGYLCGPALVDDLVEGLVR